MNASLTSFDTPHFRVLSEDQIRQIHMATLDVLANVGVKVHAQEGRDLLQDAGCAVEDELVRIPAHLVEDAIRSCPSRFTVYDRNGDPALRIEGRRAYFGTGVTCPNVRDPHTGERRPFRVKDVEDFARLVDALPNIDWMMPLGSVQDTPSAASDVYEFEAAVNNTTKPICFICHDRRGVSDVFEMAAAVAGSKEALRARPFVVSYPEPSSPLFHVEEAAGKLLYTAEEGMPIIYTPCPMSGSTAPVTMAGLLVTANAECLSGLVMAQLKRPGVPFVIGGVLTILDMARVNISYGAPELSLLMAGYADIASFYGIPTWGTAGCTDSKAPDEQAGIEATFSCVINALAGLNLIHDPGFLEGGLVGSFELVVMVDEIAGMIKRLMRGIPVNEETLARDVIREVGPGGSFLGEEHTVRHFREEHWFPTLMDRTNYTEWCATGEKTMGRRVSEKVRGILESHRPDPLPEDVRRRLREIRERSERERGA